MLDLGMFVPEKYTGIQIRRRVVPALGAAVALSLAACLPNSITQEFASPTPVPTPVSEPDLSVLTFTPMCSTEDEVSISTRPRSPHVDVFIEGLREQLGPDGAFVLIRRPGELSAELRRVYPHDQLSISNTRPVHLGHMNRDLDLEMEVRRVGVANLVSSLPVARLQTYMGQVLGRFTIPKPKEFCPQ